jgi:hypothetical protein
MLFIEVASVSSTSGLPDRQHIRMLLAYSRSLKDDLSARELRILRVLIQEWDFLPPPPVMRH